MLNTKNEIVKKVESNMTAKEVKSGNLDVLSTPYLLAFIEETCWKSIDKFIAERETTVGINVNFSHDRASLVGDELICVSNVTEVDGKKITFEFEVKDTSDNIISKGRHQRFIVDKEKFMNRLKENK